MCNLKITLRAIGIITAIVCFGLQSFVYAETETEGTILSMGIDFDIQPDGAMPPVYSSRENHLQGVYKSVNNHNGGEGWILQAHNGPSFPSPYAYIIYRFDRAEGDNTLYSVDIKTWGYSPEGVISLDVSNDGEKWTNLMLSARTPGGDDLTGSVEVENAEKLYVRLGLTPNAKTGSGGGANNMHVHWTAKAGQVSPAMLWTFEARDYTARINKKTGNVCGLIWKKTGRDFLNGREGYVKVSGTSGSWGQPGASSWKVTDSNQTDTSMGKQLILKQKAKGAPWSIERKYTFLPDALRCDVTVCSDVAETHEIQVRFVCPALTGDTRVFITDAKKVRPLNEVEDEYTYNIPDQWTIKLPSFTVLAPATDEGITFITPFEFKKPTLVFKPRLGSKSGSAEKNPEIFVDVNNLQLPGKGKAATQGIIYVPHAGCWRPGLGWMLANYREYFEPRQAIRKYEANIVEAFHVLNDPANPVHFQTNANSLKAYLKHVVGLGANWILLSPGHMWELKLSRGELYGYGEYLPEDTDPELRDAINQFINLAAEEGIGVFPYINFIEFEQKLFDKYGWKDWIIQIAPGEYWGFTDPNLSLYLMNPADLPGNSWREHIFAQAERFIEKYPNIGGFWVDRTDYTRFDVSKDDGISMVDGKPVYSVGFAQEDCMRRLRELCDKHNKAIYAAASGRIEMLRDADGIMMEGGSRQKGSSHIYCALAKPIMCFRAWGTPEVMNPVSEEARNASLDKVTEWETRWGLTVGAHIEIQGTRPLPVFERVKPLVRLLDGREWILDAHALELPKGVEGNIFRRANGDVIVPVVLPELDMKAIPVEITVRFSGMEKVKTVEMITEENHEYVSVPFEMKDGRIIVSVPELKSSAVIVLRQSK